MKAIRRLGKTPQELGNTTGVSGSPDIIELDDGSIGAIGPDITDEIGLEPLPGVKCGPGERIIRLPRNTFVFAAKDITES